MNPSPILKALSSMKRNGVQTLLMGGQACLFYGAAEFSRDLDLLVLEARPIAVPPFEARFLEAGHAVHFRGRRADVGGLRIDVMSRLRGVDEFDALWARRTTIEVDDQSVDLMSLADLVLAKKTQREKDWPMIRRLVEQNYLEHRDSPSSAQVRFWLRELRTPELLIRVVAQWAREAEGEQVRPAVDAAIQGNEDAVAACLRLEEDEERQRDRVYWQPLRRELERLRHGPRA